MSIPNRFAELHAEITEWRRDLHRHPELLFDTHRTSGIVAEKLQEFGCDEVVTGLGRTGVVGIIKGRDTSSGKVIGLRADMDALPMQETSGVPHASETPGMMHACGHDGHTAMLLGAAKYLAETRNFNGTVAVIFQPAEEGGGGGREMVEDGMMERFDIDEVYGMHNRPGTPVGEFCLRPGPLMAAVDMLTIDVTGLGGHAARPHVSIDSTLVCAQIVVALQPVISRRTAPDDHAVVSITSFHTESDTQNVLPQTAHLRGTIRTLNAETRDRIEADIKRIVTGVCKAYGATAGITYERSYPVTVNNDAATDFCAAAAADIVGQGNVDTGIPAVMGGEDFSYMLEKRPGAMIFIGNGDSAQVHHPDYDFNDDAIPVGCLYWTRLVEKGMPVT
ncbi:M20 aminoacylase family protein [Halovulum sp. GXIMD14793]